VFEKEDQDIDSMGFEGKAGIMRLVRGSIAGLAVTLAVLLCSCGEQRGQLPEAKPADAALYEAEQGRIKQAEATKTKVSPETSRSEEPKLIAAKPPEMPPAEGKIAETKPPAKRADAEREKPQVPQVAEQPDVVAQVGDYVVTRQELEDKLLEKLRSNEISYKSGLKAEDIQDVLTDLMIEKAFIIQGRRENLLENSFWLREMSENDLINALFRKELSPKIKVTEAEIEAKIKKNPKLDRSQAERALRREKAMALRERYYKQIYKKRNVRKLRHNFPKAARIHQRLLYQPKKERRGYWIQKWQIDEELTPEEKGIVLATFDGGKVTLKDWFYTLHKIVPTHRPRDLNTIEGVNRLLEQTLQVALLVAEAKSLGLDKDPAHVKKVRNTEERLIKGQIRNRVIRGLDRPTDEEAKSYFDNHKDEFKSLDTIRIDQIWCSDLATAEQVAEELKEGTRDFESVKRQYSLNKEERPRDVTVKDEGVFFDILWGAEPNQIVGPTKGFYFERAGRSGKWQVRWRVVKILSKRPGKLREFSGSVKRQVKAALFRRRKEKALREYGEQLLKKLPHKIYSEKLKNIDPLTVS